MYIYIYIYIYIYAAPWPEWGRYEAGHPHQVPEPASSAVITREASVPENLSGGVETFMPRRLLFGGAVGGATTASRAQNSTTIASASLSMAARYMSSSVSARGCMHRV